MFHDASPRAHDPVRFLVGLATLVVPIALLAGCDGDHGDDVELSLPAGAGDEPVARPAGSSDLTTHDRAGACPGFGVAISVEGNDVSLDWSTTGPAGGAVAVYRSVDPELLLDLEAGASPEDVERIVLEPGTTHYTDVGAADRDDHTPTYYYRVGVQTDRSLELSTMVMKTTTAMAPGYNKFGACMLDGPARASDVVARLGSSVVGVWGWDAEAQSYLSWTPAQGVGTAADFVIPFGGLFAAQVDDSTPPYQSLVGVVPRDDAFEVSGEPGYNWSTIPVFYDGPSNASYWVDDAGYWGMGRWDNLTQSSSFYWGSGHADFTLEACQPYYMYLPDTACTSNEDCGDDKFCYFVDAATCGDVAAGLCKPQPMGCENAPPSEVCGCDGVTYPSECVAERAGASVAEAGACDPCAGEPCVTGTCSPVPTNENGGGGGYACECEPGFSGILCDVPDVPDVPECIDEDTGSLAPQTIEDDLVGDSDEHTPSCAAGGGGGDRVFQFTAASAGMYQFDTLGTTAFDTVLAVYDACGGSEVACSDDADVWPNSLSSVIVMNLVAGQSVLIVVDSYDGEIEDGSYSLNIAAVDGYDCEANNPCTQENYEAGLQAFESTISTTFIQCIYGAESSYCYRINCLDEEQEWEQPAWVCGA
jgi:hypothetical protein